jgi:hypothetical protein
MVTSSDLNINDRAAVAKTSVRNNPMPALYQRLAQLGIRPILARKALPDWWDDDIALTPAGRQQAELFFSVAFNLDLKSFENSTSPLKFLAINCKYKLTRNLSEKQVETGANFINAIAKIALQGMDAKSSTVPLNPLDIRETILKTNDCVNLDSLLRWCYAARIPVVFVDRIPGRKMAGLVVRDQNSYAIALCKKGSRSHLLFYLAHELGHIGHNHLSIDGFVADVKCPGTNSQDADEKEADAYAIRLINGASVAYSATGIIDSAQKLYTAANQSGQQWHIDVGHIILNYGFSQKNFALANSAIKLVPNFSTGAETVNELFWQQVGSNLSLEKQGLLKNLLT